MKDPGRLKLFSRGDGGGILDKSLTWSLLFLALMLAVWMPCVDSQVMSPMYSSDASFGDLSTSDIGKDLRFRERNDQLHSKKSAAANEDEDDYYDDDDGKDQQADGQDDEYEDDNDQPDKEQPAAEHQARAPADSHRFKETSGSGMQMPSYSSNPNDYRFVQIANTMEATAEVQAFHSVLTVRDGCDEQMK